jgi:hypothetical protein
MRSASIAVAALHREWRTQRDTLVKLAAVTPLLVGAITCALLWNGSTSRDTVGASALCALLLGYAGIAPGLIAGELERGSLCFLARTPRALGSAFFAKLVVLLLAPCAIAALGIGCAALLRLAISAGSATAFFAWIEGYVVLGLLVALWSLPVGACVRSGLVLPVSLLLAAAIYVPLGMRLEGPRVSHVGLAVGATVLAALSSGWLALHRTRASGGSVRRAALGAAVPLLFLVPGLHAWAGAIAPPSSAPGSQVVRSARTVLAQAFLGAEGRRLYVTYVPLGAERYSSLVLDASSGEVLREEEGSYYGNLGAFDSTQMISGSFGSHSWLVRIHTDDRSKAVFETRGESVVLERSSGARANFDSELDQAVRSAKRETTPWRDEQGRRLWFHAGRGEVETATGDIEVREAPPSSRFAAIGGSVRISSGSPVLRPWDHLRWREISKLGPGRTYLGSLRLGWLTQTEEAWEILDPETALPKLHIPRAPIRSSFSQRVLPIREGAALITVHEWEARRSELLLIDGAESAVRAVSVRGLEPNEIRGIDHGGYFYCEARDAQDRLLVVVQLERSARLARFDPEKALLEVLSCIESQQGETPLHAIATAGEDDVLVLTERRIVRASFATDRCTVLYEVDQP